MGAPELNTPTPKDPIYTNIIKTTNDLLDSVRELLVELNFYGVNVPEPEICQSLPLDLRLTEMIDEVPAALSTASKVISDATNAMHGAFID